MTSRIFLVLSLALLVHACVDNRESFYIEHVKVLPEFPDCEYSVGDPVSPFYNVDLNQAGAVNGVFYVTNALMAKEDYANLVAESNGIFVERFEVYSQIGSSAVAPKEEFSYHHYIPPESSDVMMAQLMSSGVVETLRQAFCVEYKLPEIADAIANGNSALLSQITPDNTPPESILSVVRYFGKTQGNIDQETQKFTFNVQPYCGPVGGWAPCFENPCFALCSKTVVAESCFPGVNAPNNCAAYLSGYSVRVPNPADPDGPAVDFCAAHCTGR